MKTQQKIKATSVNNPIKKVEVDFNSLVKFSFKYFHTEHEKFYPNSSCKENDYFLQLINILKTICELKMNEFLNPNGKNRILRAHSHKWNNTSEPNGYSHINEEVVGDTGYQFSVKTNKYGRVHGFVIDTTFYIVWLDPHHKLYPLTN